MPATQTNWTDLEARYYMRTFNRLPVVFERGEGCYVYDEHGKQYLDLVGGIAVNILGHAHPAIVQAITNQAQRLIHTSSLYYSEPQLELAEWLVERSPADRIFFANSGAEANEGAIKLARKYGRTRRNGAYEVITVSGSFHGRTLATIAATAQPKYQQPFAPMPAGFKHVPFNDFEAMRSAVDYKTAAIMLECIQGESGIRIHDRAYLEAVRELCDEQNILLICDEIQCGLGRTGTFYGFQQFGIEPDVITLAKGLAGGLPIGAFLAKEACAVLTAGDHGSTMGGNPVCCAAGLAAMRYLEEHDLMGNAARTGQAFLDELGNLKETMPGISALRGMGLMVAFDTTQEIAAAIVKAGLERGLIVNNTGPRTIRLVPPLIISDGQVEKAVGLIADALKDARGG
ncbi:MAG TPA: acetylornithine transaminase [Chloroflexota bacterium]|nr:acetylornithine transaminase [Chloroflexota bacterium]